MNKKDSDWVIIGRFGRPQGLKGLIRVISFTDPESSILEYKLWHMLQKGLWLPLEKIHSEIQNQTILVGINGYMQREEVAALTNIEIGVPRDQLPTLSHDEYYWHDLKDMQVLNQAGETLGHVVQILPTGANDVLVVQGDKRHLIPYMPGVYIISVDLTQKLIVVDWDEHF